VGLAVATLYRARRLVLRIWMLSWPPTMMKPATLLRMRTRLAIVIWFWTQLFLISLTVVSI
jgi:hypothetical protein